MTIHERRIRRTRLMVNQRPNLRSPREIIPILHQQLMRQLLLRDDDELLPQHARLVDGAELVSPLLELEPQPKAGDIVDAADDGILLRPWKLARLGRGGIVCPCKAL